MKEVCKKCAYWNTKLEGTRHYYKCYGGDCPAKIRDDNKHKQEILRRRQAMERRRNK